jgi:sulfite reductase beta subunit-like hemoprotein
LEEGHKETPNVLQARDIAFPCEAVPADPKMARLVGLYPQRQEGRWMQRVKVLGGVLSARHWRALGAIARRQVPATPLHLTTRQDVEFHDLAADVVPEVQRALQEAGLTGLGACGDAARNITVCPCSGTRAGLPDLVPLAWSVRHLLETAEGAFDLPRKFKVSFSACPEGCAGPWINDLGFVATRRGGGWGFRVMAGGSLGPRPGVGMLLADGLPADDVLPLVLAAVRFFAAHGDREDRRRARLRHVRERLGDPSFAAAMRGALDAARCERPWPPVPLAETVEGLAARATLVFPNGDVSPEAAEALADLAGAAGVAVRIAPHHRVVVFGREEAALRAAIEGHEALSPAARPQPSVVSCPGTRWCSRGIVDTNALADRLRRELAGTLPADTTVCISGCPNGCAQHAVAPIGLVGALTGADGRRREVFNLLVGGDLGRSGRLAAPLAARLRPDEVAAAIAAHLGPHR